MSSDPLDKHKSIVRCACEGSNEAELTIATIADDIQASANVYKNRTPKGGKIGVRAGW
jgi:hypothetical protein